MRNSIVWIAVILGPSIARAAPPAPTAPAPAAPATAGPLDGKTFDVMTSEPGKAPTADKLVFAAGTFRSTGCDPYGFTAAPYVAKPEGTSWTFTATTTSPKEGSIAWTGKVDANGAVSGTYAWTKAGQATITYTFTSAAPAPAPK